MKSEKENIQSQKGMQKEKEQNESREGECTQTKRKAKGERKE
jgi:hypothetical protein